MVRRGSQRGPVRWGRRQRRQGRCWTCGALLDAQVLRRRPALGLGVGVGAELAVLGVALLDDGSIAGGVRDLVRGLCSHEGPFVGSYLLRRAAVWRARAARLRLAFGLTCCGRPLKLGVLAANSLAHGCLVAKAYRC